MCAVGEEFYYRNFSNRQFCGSQHIMKNWHLSAAQYRRMIAEYSLIVRQPGGLYWASAIWACFGTTGNLRPQRWFSTVFIHGQALQWRLVPLPFLCLRWHGAPNGEDFSYLNSRFGGSCGCIIFMGIKWSEVNVYCTGGVADVIFEASTR
jgi:hypothetical protein